MITATSSDQGDIQQKVEDELARILQKVITENKEIMSELPKVKEIYGWYKEIKDSKHEDIPAKVVNVIIENLLDSLVCCLSKFLIYNIKIKFENIQSNDIEIKEVELDFVVKPFVDFIKKINKIDTLKARILFKFTLAGKLEGIRIRSIPKMRNIHIEGFVGPLTISIIGLEISIAQAPMIPMVLEKPIQLLGTEIFKMENITLML